MKKTIILLLLVSFCGGATESGSATSEDVSVEVNEVTPEAKNENDQEQVESKETSDEETTIADEETTTTSVSESKILWGLTDAKPEVYAAADVSQTTVDLTVEWVNKAIGHWGSYGPLEIWIVGTGKEETIALKNGVMSELKKTQHGINSGIAQMETHMKVVMVGHLFIDI